MAESVIRENLERIRRQIEDAEKASGREPGSVRLCAVSKFHPAAAVLEALGAGQRLFGENRVQEADRKFSEVREAASGCELHIIGTLQRNKIKRAVGIADCIQSVDREEVLRDIERHASDIGKTVSIMFEMHTGEESKAGIQTQDELWRLLELCAGGAFPHVSVTGLMTMAPFTENRSLVHASFAALRDIRERASADFPGLPLTELSMGMSGDFGIAIEEGSTMVRIGTAIFGVREAAAT